MFLHSGNIGFAMAIRFFWIVVPPCAATRAA